MPNRPAARRDALAAYYSHHRQRLFAAARARVNRVGDDLIHDACAYAWLQLVRRGDVTLDARGLGWLTVTAPRESWRLADTTREHLAGTLITAADPSELL